MKNIKVFFSIVTAAVLASSCGSTNSQPADSSQSREGWIIAKDVVCEGILPFLQGEVPKFTKFDSLKELQEKHPKEYSVIEAVMTLGGKEVTPRSVVSWLSDAIDDSLRLILIPITQVACAITTIYGA